MPSLQAKQTDSYPPLASVARGEGRAQCCGHLNASPICDDSPYHFAFLYPIAKTAHQDIEDTNYISSPKLVTQKANMFVLHLKTNISEVYVHGTNIFLLMCNISFFNISVSIHWIRHRYQHK